MTTTRIEKLKAGLNVEKFPICIEKVRLMTEAYRRSEGQPEILRRAKALAHTLDHITIFIRDGELIVGNGASAYMGVELEFIYGPWPREEILALGDEGWLISDEHIREVEEMNEYWRGRSLVSRIGLSFDDDRLWPFMQTGIVLAPWKTKEEGSGGGYAESGMGLGPGFYNIVEDYEKVLRGGLVDLIRQAEEERKSLRFLSPGSIEKGYFLDAAIISLKAVIRFAGRFSTLASKMAENEKDSQRKRELEDIADRCARVPAHPARTFHEAIQSFWFCYLMINPSTTAGMGRMDQYLYPFYKRDIEEGRLSDDEALELLQCLRIKDMELNRISGKLNRQKNAGLAKWHNCTLGGQTRDGRDATNELTYLFMEAALQCPTPHHTITLRVHDGTPADLMLKAVEILKTGIGMPAFVGDKSYIAFLTSHGVPIEEARDYALAGCLDAALAGNSQIMAFGMFIVPMVLEIALHNGLDLKSGRRLGPETGDPKEFDSFDQVLAAFKTQLVHFLGLNAEYNNIWIQAIQDFFPDPVRTALMDNPFAVGKSIAGRTYRLNNAAVLNMVGMINAADSLTAVKKLVFDDQKYSMAQLMTALAANWEGFEDMRRTFVTAPKYGNGDARADAMAADLYRFFAETAATIGTVLDGPHMPSAISISAQGPGGAQTGATPDGRLAGSYLADGSISPIQGADTCGPTAVICSALKIDQDVFQATLLNMKFHPMTLAKETDRQKLAMLIRTYLAKGGKHVQFNMTNREILEAAKQEPEQHRDLMVRVAGYSAYFVKLTPPIQDEIISRTEQSIS